MRMLLVCLSTFFFQSSWAQPDVVCRGLLVAPLDTYKDVSNEEILSQAQRFFTIDTVTLGEGPLSQIVLVGGGPLNRFHRRASELFDELLVRFPVRVVGLKVMD